MRISDWSSDVCSSDLDHRHGGRAAVAMIVGRDPDSLDAAAVSRAAIESLAENFSDGVVAPRSEERRVGKECVSTGRSGWSPLPLKTTNISLLHNGSKRVH